MNPPDPPAVLPEPALRLLVADDDPAMQRLVSGILSPRWEVEVVGDGAAALRACRAQPPALLVADLLMPELDGFELLRELRRDAATRTLPVIVLSGLTEEEDRIRAFEAGATDFLIKPFSGRELQLRVSNQLEMIRLRREEVERARMLDDAREASRLKDEFLATLSHELRTPLNAIVGWAHMLRTGTLDEAGFKRAVDTIDRNARVQNQLIGDILDISRIIAGKLHLDMRAVDLRKVIEAAIDTVRPSAEAKGVRILSAFDETTGPAFADPDRLQQVVWNLLSNAIKFTPPGGLVNVSLRAAGTRAEITVQDTGAGIGAAFLPHVFERFRQADGSHARRSGGLGLGLAIVHHLVEKHGGSVTARSAGENRGATFVVSIPLLAAAGGDFSGHVPPLVEPGPGFEGAPSLEGLRVLLVDDEEDARDLVAAVLRQKEATVLTAATAADAFEIVKRQRPDVLVCDLGLPGEDGYAFIRRVRALSVDEGGRTPATALSAYAQSEDRMRALMAGFQMHVAKPAQPIELVAVIASLVDRRRA